MGTDAHSRSVFWFAEAESEVPGESCPPLTGATTADICIVGGGYTGLWTALEITAHSPDSQVTLIEAGVCGFGASGRNCGWATSWCDRIGDLVGHFGQEQGLWLAERSSEAIEWLDDFLAAHGFASYFRRRGRIWVANGMEQQRQIAAVTTACRRYRRDDLIEEVDAEHVAAVTGYQGSNGGLMIRDAAAVQPAILVRLLREEALRRGVRIYESTAMVALDRGRRPVVTTASGQINAETVVLATNAWAAGVPELRRGVVAVASQMVLSEPLGDRIDSLEWSHGALLGDARHMAHLAQVTTDGRIAFGRRGGILGRRGRLLPNHFYDPVAIAEVAAEFRRWFPQLEDVQLTHAWCGPDDRAPHRLPFIGSLGDFENIHYGIGYSGNGVAQSALVGRILGRYALGIRDEYTRCGLVSGLPGRLPPEPLRQLTGKLSHRVAERAEGRRQSGYRLGTLGQAAKRLKNRPSPRFRR